MKDTQRIAIFIPSLYGGGVERVMTVLSAGFAERGHPVDLVLAQAEGPLLGSVDPRVRVVDLGGRRVLASVAPLVRYLRRERPAALLAGMTHANVIAILARKFSGCGCRLVVGTHNYLTSASRVSPHRLDRLMPQLARWFYPMADHALAVSEAVAGDLRAATSLPAEFVSAIPNPIDLECVRRRAAEAVALPWPDPDAAPLLLGVGRLVPEKGFDVLLSALPAVHAATGARLVLLGEGPERAALQKRARDLELETAVAMPGFVENPFAWMTRADLVVAPSRMEGFGNVLVEAMACGTPVVATSCPGGPAEILDDGTYGPLVPVEDPDALAAVIVATLQAPAAPELLRSRAAAYDRPLVVDRMLEVMLGAS